MRTRRPELRLQWHRGLLGSVAMAVFALVVLTGGCSEESRDRIGDAVGGAAADGGGGDQQAGGGGGDQQAGGGGGDQQAGGGDQQAGGGGRDQQAGGGGQAGDGAGGDGGGEPAAGDGGGQAGDGGGEPAPGDNGAGDDTAIIPDDGNDLAGSDFVILVIVGALAVMAVLVVMHFASAQQGQREQARSVERRNTAAIIGSVRWITDQASMEVMRLTDPRQLTASWQATRARCLDVERQLAMAVAAETDLLRRDQLDELGRSCAALRVALEADVALRTDPVAPERPDLVILSTQTVQQRRAELQYALADLERARR